MNLLPGIRRCLLALAALACWGMVGVSPAAVDMYIKFDGVDGESPDDRHKNWIDVLSFSHGVSRAATYGTPGQERSTGYDLVLTKRVDRSSPKLLMAVCGATPITSATLEVWQTYGPSETSLLFLKIEMRDIIVTATGTHFKEAILSTPVPEPTADTYRHFEELKLSYAKIDFTYIARNPETGEILDQTTGGWNAATDTPLSPIDFGTAWRFR